MPRWVYAPYPYTEDLLALSVCFPRDPRDLAPLPVHLQRVQTQLQAAQWWAVLANYLDKQFTQYLLDSLEKGFWVGLDYTDYMYSVAKNPSLLCTLKCSDLAAHHLTIFLITWRSLFTPQRVAPLLGYLHFSMLCKLFDSEHTDRSRCHPSISSFPLAVHSVASGWLSPSEYLPPIGYCCWYPRHHHTPYYTHCTRARVCFWSRPRTGQGLHSQHQSSQFS